MSKLGRQLFRDSFTDVTRNSLVFPCCFYTFKVTASKREPWLKVMDGIIKKKVFISFYIILRLLNILCYIYYISVYSIGRKDLKSLNSFLTGKKYLLGNECCNEDASIFGMISQYIYHETGPLHHYIMSKLLYVEFYDL